MFTKMLNGNNPRVYILIALTSLMMLLMCCDPVESRTISGGNHRYHLKKEFNMLPYSAVQMCRDSCLGRFLNKVSNKGEGETTKDECSGRPDCFMCWDYCGMLHKEHKMIASLMCSDNICVRFF